MALYDSLRASFIDMAEAIRDQLERNEDLSSSIELHLHASFHPHHGELKCTFGIGEYCTSNVQGWDIQAVVDEFDRRFRKDKELEPLCLPRVRE
jgi:hypothetical protein